MKYVESILDSNDKVAIDKLEKDLSKDYSNGEYMIWDFRTPTMHKDCIHEWLKDQPVIAQHVLKSAQTHEQSQAEIAALAITKSITQHQQAQQQTITKTM